MQIGGSLDSNELQHSFTRVIFNIYNVYYVDSRKVNAFYKDIIDTYIFGPNDRPLDFESIIKSDILVGKKFVNHFVTVMMFTTFQNEQCYHYAVNALVHGVYDTKNQRIHQLLITPEQTPMKLKVFVSGCYMKMKRMSKDLGYEDTYSHDQLELRILSI